MHTEQPFLNDGSQAGADAASQATSATGTDIDSAAASRPSSASKPASDIASKPASSFASKPASGSASEPASNSTSDFAASSESALPPNARTVSLTALQEALDAAQPGDTIWVEPGTYRDIALTLTYAGDGPVTVRARQAGEVVVTGASLITLKNSRNLTLAGFLFDRVTSDNSLVLDGSSGIHVTDHYFYRNGKTPTSKIVGIRNGSAGNKLYRNTFDESRGQSVALYNGHTPEDANNTDNEIYRNLFFNIPSVGSVYPGKTNGLEAVQLGQGKEVRNVFRTKVFENVFEEVTGDRAEIISVKSSGNEIYRNTFRNNASGLTIRLGESNRIADNYFENTDKGIRTYGYDQTIERNYMVGGSHGIQLPAADTKTGETPIPAAPYYQSDRSRITGNVMVKPLVSGFTFGGNYKPGTWELLPTGVTVERNLVVLAHSARDYILDEAAAEAAERDHGDPIASFVGNRSYLNTERNRGNIGSADSGAIEYVISASPDIPPPEAVTGVTPFQSLDERTGAGWRRPAKR